MDSSIMQLGGMADACKFRTRNRRAEKHTVRQKTLAKCAEEGLPSLRNLSERLCRQYKSSILTPPAGASPIDQEAFLYNHHCQVMMTEAFGQGLTGNVEIYAPSKCECPAYDPGILEARAQGLAIT